LGRVTIDLLVTKTCIKSLPLQNTEQALAAKQNRNQIRRIFTTTRKSNCLQTSINQAKEGIDRQTDVAAANIKRKTCLEAAQQN
jgi:hypothetical protein